MSLRTILVSIVVVPLAMMSGCDAASSSREEVTTTLAPSSDQEPFDKNGFVIKIEDGRLWVFTAGSKELADFEKHGELAKHVIRPGAGPAGITIKAPDLATIQAYTAAKDGFVTLIEDGRVWAFDPGSEALADFEKHGELAKHVIRPGAGPAGMTVKAPDSETLLRYVHTKPGFVTQIEDGRLWVFRSGSQEQADFRIHGELAKHVIHPGAGPGGMTIKAPDQGVIRDYMVTVPGFVTEFEDDRLWVFRAGSAELEDFRAHGELAKHVIRPSAGPGGITLKAPGAEVLERYLADLR